MDESIHERQLKVVELRANEQVLKDMAVFPGIARFDEAGRSNLWTVAPHEIN
ncbi:hypothetical protein PQQ96_40665 [Paraburkholderia sediminicola]|uniref:hypothetical protein n=1 Tax=Paraburkholderia sediminicola TaxID=458836 RepID=UPI0038BBCBE7